MISVLVEVIFEVGEHCGLFHSMELKAGAATVPLINHSHLHF